LIECAARGELADAFARLDGCGADADLVRLAKACLAVKPADRPCSGATVAEQGTAYRGGGAARLRRAALGGTGAEAAAAEERRRRRTQLALAAAVLLLLTLVGGGTWYVRQQSLEHQADQARQETARVLREAHLVRTVADDLDRLELARKEHRWNEA